MGQPSRVKETRNPEFNYELSLPFGTAIGSGVDNHFKCYFITGGA